ncbi:MAG: TRZ/ATZ family hydrolase [Gammaproteobacteria bacterium]|nr:TRZ/ATZ family hydrolase [Gammaproteobacteria bacterium]
MELMDTIISAKWVIPVVPAGKILHDHSVLIQQGKIHDIIPSNEISGRYQATHHIKMDNHAVLPGFVNSHSHSPMSLLRGVADDLPLKSWLEKHIWPLESRHVSEQFCYDGSNLAMVEMIRSGTTCVSDMYFFPESTAEAVDQAGMRATIGLTVIDFPTNWAQSIDEYFELGLKMAERYRNHPLISCHFAPHAPYTVNDDAFNRIRTLSTELQLPIQMHIHETLHEVEESLSIHGLRPLQRLENLGLLGPDLQAVHMTELADDEIERLAEYNVHVVHCPESNMKLASGICPVAKLLKAGVNVALGTDGSASNNDLDMLGEMRSAAFLGKIGTMEATAVSAIEALSMATINGAKALGMDDKIGSLEIGKQADIIAIDFDRPEQYPMFQPISQIVYCTDRTQVTDAWVAGRHLMKSRELTTLDVDQIVESAKKWQQTLTSREQL